MDVAISLFRATGSSGTYSKASGKSYGSKGTFKALGTDGFGRSDSRANLRTFFEVDTNYIVFTTLAQLAKLGKVEKSVVTEAMKKYNIDVNKPNPLKA